MIAHAQAVIPALPTPPMIMCSKVVQGKKGGRGRRGRAEPTVSIIKFLIHITHTRSITRSKAQKRWKLTSTVNKNVDALQSVFCSDEGYLRVKKFHRNGSEAVRHWQPRSNDELMPMYRQGGEEGEKEEVHITYRMTSNPVSAATSRYVSQGTPSSSSSSSSKQLMPVPTPH